MKRLKKKCELENETINAQIGNKQVIIFKNPTNAEYEYLIDKFKEEYPNAYPGEPKTRQTYDKEGNKYVWMSGDSMHYWVENYLKDTKGIECNQNQYFD